MDKYNVLGAEWDDDKWKHPFCAQLHTEAGDVFEHGEKSLFLDVSVRVALDFDVKHATQRIRVRHLNRDIEGYRV